MIHTMKGRKDMVKILIKNGFLFIVLLMIVAGCLPAIRPGRYPRHRETGPPTFTLTAKAGSIRTGDGDSVPMWGYADTSVSPDNDMQFPGPTLIVNQDATVSITLKNQLSFPCPWYFRE